MSLPSLAARLLDVGDDEPFARSRIDQARRRNERIISLAAICVGLGSVPPLIWRTVHIDARGGLWILAFVTVLLAYYAASWRYYRCRIPGRTTVFLRTALEVSIPTTIMLIDAEHSAMLALTDTTIHLYLLVVMVAALRLLPPLPIFAAVLGLVEIALGNLAIARAPGLSLPTMGLVFGLQRAVFLLAGGVVGFLISRTLRTLVHGVAREVRERERVRQAFGAYVAQPVMERILSGDLDLETERRDVSVLFVDVRGFTTLSESTDPGTLLERLNRALEAFSRSVAAEGGIVNKYLGDGLMAIFGAPERQVDHARRAARAALDIARVAGELDGTGGFPGLRIGVGLHSGEAIVGDVGSEARREYTAMGDVVNVASRVESLNKTLGTTVLVTGAVADRLDGAFRLRRLEPATLRGREAPVDLYELEGEVRDA